ncbi:MAG: DUF4783 domain-containing protein [Melioribacteraceae bacterium]|jgi:hypothetical protein|nr:DUF4783 domain-containing protein [Melioribacteraceae bacterium]
MEKMRTNSKNIIRVILIALLFSIFNEVTPQDKKINDAAKIFLRIEEGIGSATVDKFSSFFSSKNYLSLSNGTNGYFSANQSFYVIKDFLSVYQPINFKLNLVNSDSNTPFASGTLKYSSNGIRGIALVYISLTQIDNHWRISQITIK